MTVRCKFKVNSVELTENNGTSIKMSPTYSNDPNSENAKFWKWSPGGSFQFNCVNPETVAHMKPGTEFYIDLIPVPTEPKE